MPTKQRILPTYITIITMLLMTMSSCSSENKHANPTTHSENDTKQNDSTFVRSDSINIKSSSTQLTSEFTDTTKVILNDCLNHSINNQISNGYPLGFLNGDIRTPQVKEDSFKKNIKIFDAPQGSEIETLLLTRYNGIGGAYILTDTEASNKKINYLDADLYFGVGYKNEFKFLKYYELKNNFIKVHFSKDKTGWINYEDVCLYLKPTRFIEDICTAGGYLLYGYDSYRVRNKPSLSGDIILKLDKRKHVITKFTEIKGNWAYAIIYETKVTLDGIYAIDEVIKRSTGNIYEGWIRVVDENGQIKDIDWNRTGC